MRCVTLCGDWISAVFALRHSLLFPHHRYSLWSSPSPSPSPLIRFPFPSPFSSPISIFDFTPFYSISFPLCRAFTILHVFPRLITFVMCKNPFRTHDDSMMIPLLRSVLSLDLTFKQAGPFLRLDTQLSRENSLPATTLSTPRMATPSRNAPSSYVPPSALATC